MCSEDVGRDLSWSGRVFFLSGSRASVLECELAVMLNMKLRSSGMQAEDVRDRLS